jgi:small subunit ribosomal protein S8
MAAISDPISDMLTRIRNALNVKHTTLSLPSSKMKIAIAEVLKGEGYIEDYKVSDLGSGKKELSLTLKYGETGSAITGVKRNSKPSCRAYAKTNKIPRVKGGLGINILSTSSGVMTGQEAQKRKIGGELLCSVW